MDWSPTRPPTRRNRFREPLTRRPQRAAWQMVGKKFPVMETGIYNLTQDTAAVLVHFADGQTQQCLLVRLPEPEQQPQQ